MELTPFFFGLYKLVKHGLYPLTWVVLLVMSSLLLLVMLPSPLVATPLIGSLEAWYQPPTADAVRSL